MSIRRMAIFLALNALVSAIVVLIVLSVWDSNRSPIKPAPTLLPTSIAQALPKPIEPTSTPIIPHTYVVQAGDTPLSIAANLGVDVNDLLSVNHLKAGDILNIGQELSVPGAGPTPTVVVTTQPVVPTIQPIATSTPSAVITTTGSVLVTIRQIDGAGDLANETIVLTNLGNKVNLSGWTLSDGAGQKYTFPDLTLLSNAEVHVHTSAGSDTASDLHWGQTGALWGGSGTIAYLRDSTGKLIATYRVP